MTDPRITPIAVMHVQTDEDVEASLITGWQPNELKRVDGLWITYLQSAKTEMRMRGLDTATIPDTIGWSWYWKYRRANSPGARWICHSIQYQGFTQGILVVSLRQEASRLAIEFGKPSIEVVYLAAAPWNIGGFMRGIRREPFLDDIGLKLIRVAIEHSSYEGCEGRLRLYSVPKAERFYSATCGMIDMGVERHDGEMLRRFELSHEQAAWIMEQ